LSPERLWRQNKKLKKDGLQAFHECASLPTPTLALPLKARVARWFVFKPKIPILVKFGGPWNEKCCYIL
jgi:hypothetical protein